MSAVFGFLRLDGRPASRDALAAMDRALAHFGPDGRDLRIDGPLALGQRMLSITPEPSPAGLAVHGDDSRWLLAADALLDNRGELAAGLALDPAEGRRRSDAELVLEACRKWGQDCPERLLGDFAFALWDGREKTLFCARDHFGIRPLFTAHLPGKLFAFASGIEGLLALSEVPRRLDELRAASFLMTFHADKESTFYRDVRALPPAHVLRLGPAGLSRRRYWQPHLRETLELGSRQDYADRLRHHVEEAVSCRLRTSHRVGSHLSGGLDSSALTVLAARELRRSGRPRPVTACLVAAPEEGWKFYDERPFVEEVCRQEDLECRYLTSPRDYGSAVAAAAVLGRERPLPRFDCDAETRCTAWMAEEGVRVVLSGWGGDELATVNGRGYYAQLFLRGRWPTLYREGAGRCRHDPFLSWHRFLLGQVVAPILPQWLFEWGGRLLGTRHFDARAMSAIHPELERRWAISRRMRREMPIIAPDLRRNLLRRISFGHLQYRIENWALIGARFGVRYRFPLLDKRLVEFCLAVPADQFVHDGWHRYLYRRAMAGVLPEAIRWRPDKFAPTPDMVRVLSRSRAAHLERIAGYEKNPILASLLDLAKLRRELETLPAEEDLRRASRREFAAGRDLFLPAVLSVEYGFALAEFLETAELC